MTAPSSFVMLSETAERFLKAVVQTLPTERIMSLHLFPAIRQGGVESGVAVVAAVPEGELVEDATPGPVAEVAAPVAEAPPTESTAEPAEPAELPELPLSALVSTEDACVRVGGDDSAPEETEDDVTDAADGESAGESESAGEARVDASEAAPVEAGESIDAVDAPPPDVAPGDAEPTEPSEAAVDALVVDIEDPAARAMAEASVEASDVAASAARPRRYIIYTARYRLVLKGAERGKWDVNVVAEADAPLLTVDAVVRGVQRRTGDAAEPERFTGTEVRRALRLPAAQPAHAAARAP